MPAHDKNLPSQDAWVPFIAGSAGQVWFDHSNVLINWLRCGLELKVQAQNLYGSYTRTIKNISYYFTHGVAFSMIGDTFSARAHRYRSIFGNKGSSVFPEDIPSTLCLMNSRAAREIMESLNPGIGFEVGDVNRLPVWPIPDAQAIYDHLEQAFTEHEEARESSIEFRRPGASPWAWAQGWAQRMVDRGVGEAWEAYAPEYEAASAWQHVSFGLGVALGRWCGEGGGVRSSAPEGSVGEGIVFVSSYEGRPDSLQHPACAPLREAWAAHGAAASGSPKGELGEWLRRSFFKDHHRASFDNRPIFWPLASARSSFVAWVSIHRLSATTLPHLLTDHLHPTLQALQAELQDLLARQAGASAKERAALDKRQAQLRKLEEELADFIAQVDACAHHGPPPPDRATPPREVDAPYDPHLDDGVMINSAALWPLLDPQWKDPKKWWKELATAQGRKDYDWARLAARYFPQRVAAKCAQDPSLAVAHGCFWRHHPDLARQWEARLQEELDDPDFRIDELGSDDARARILMQGATQEPTRSQGPADADADADFYSSPSRRAVGKLGTS